MSSQGGNTVPRITQAEHIGPNDTGDNIEAKRSANYVWNGSEWQRQGLTLVAGANFDYIDVQQTSATVETYVYKQGGSGGTTVQTIVITYTSSGKTDIDTVVYS